MPRVSVIMPTYNRREYVQEAIDSVLAQTYTDYEIIVIDDGSTDGTGEVLRERYGESIRYGWQDNAGRSAARNRGLDRASGVFVAFLDDDDLYLPGKLAAQVAYLDAYPEVGLVASGVRFIDAHGVTTGAWRPWEQQPELTLSRCVCSCPLTTCGVLLRREALSNLDHWFDPAIGRAEDTDLFLRLLLSGCRMAWLEEIVADYRQHPASSQGDAEAYVRGYLDLYRKLFARSDLPPGVAHHRAEVLARVHIDGASRHYVLGQSERAQSELEAAAALVPAWLGSGELLERALCYPESPMVFVDAKLYRELMLASLPAELDRPAIRRRALARVAMAQVFGAAARGDWATVRAHWWQGVRQDPSWLKNRGVWAIGFKALAGAVVPGRPRNGGSDG